MVRKYFDTDSQQIVPKGSATIDRYASIGIHANHMDMTKFPSDGDPDYRNVVSELQRLTQPHKQQPEQELPLAASESSENQGQFHREISSEGSSAKERSQATMNHKNNSYQPSKTVNTFSGTFNTNGGKIIQGGEFNSGGGPMSF